MSRVDPIAWLGMVVAVVWTAVSIWQPETTYHFGPLIISFTLSAGLSIAWYWRALVSASVTLVFVVLVIGFGGLAGADFFGARAAGPEAVLLTLLGAGVGTLWGWIVSRNATTTTDDPQVGSGDGSGDGDAESQRDSHGSVPLAPS